MQIFTPPQGVLILAGFAAFVSSVVWIFSRGILFTKLQFLVVNRKVGAAPAALAIAAMWIWAPALFVSAQKAYTQGWVGFFWFWVPNVLCLIIFGYFMQMMRRAMPEGYTGSDYMRKRHSRRVQNEYLIAFSILAMCSFAVQLVAGGKMIASLTGLPYGLTTVLLALIPIGYSLYSGMRASVISNALQMVIILGVGAILIPWTIAEGGGMGAVWAGLYGKSDTYSSLFSGDGLLATIFFGIPVTLGLLAGPFGDQSFYQQGYSIKEGKVRRSFASAAFIFGIVPLGMSLLGFLAAGIGMQTMDSQTINIQVVEKFLPPWVIVPFVYLLLSGLVSTLDSNMSAIASLAGHDIYERRAGGDASYRKGDVIPYSRKGMLLLVAGGIGIANIPGIEIVYLFLFYGTVRASTLLPTVITLLKKDVSERGMYWGILASMLVGLPLAAIGNLGKIDSVVVGASLFTVFASGIIVLVASRKYAQTYAAT